MVLDDVFKGWIGVVMVVGGGQFDVVQYWCFEFVGVFKMIVFFYEVDIVDYWVELVGVVGVEWWQIDCVKFLVRQQLFGMVVGVIGFFVKEIEILFLFWVQCFGIFGEILVEGVVEVLLFDCLECCQGIGDFYDCDFFGGFDMFESFNEFLFIFWDYLYVFGKDWLGGVDVVMNGVDDFVFFWVVRYFELGYEWEDGLCCQQGIEVGWKLFFCGGVEVIFIGVGN